MTVNVKLIKSDLSDKYNSAIIQSTDAKSVKKIKTSIKLYKEIALEVKIPWEVIACLHYRESSLNIKTWLANGDPLTAPTVHVPKNLGQGLTFPITFKQACILSLAGRAETLNTIEDMLYYMEIYNGLGYRRKGLVTPYLWSGTNHYTSGKFSSDGHYDPDLKDKQLGCVVILKELLKSV